jgi:hypothetical protein
VQREPPASTGVALLRILKILNVQPLGTLYENARVMIGRVILGQNGVLLRVPILLRTDIDSAGHFSQGANLYRRLRSVLPSN